MYKFLIVCVLCILTVFGAQLPAEFPKCKAGDTVCLQRVITNVIQKYPNGYPEIFLPAIDPFRVDELKVEQGQDKPIAIKLNFTNLDFKGLSKFDVYKVVGFDKDPKTSKFEVYAKTPKVEIIGDYQIDGKVLILPIQGVGKSSIILENVEIGVKFLPKVNEKNGKTYVQVDRTKMNIEVSKMTVHFTNLFNGDKALGDNMNLFLNQNWKDIFEELNPAISEAMAQIVKSIINRIFSKLSYDDIWLN